MPEVLSIVSALAIGSLLVRAFDPVRNMQPRWAAVLFDIALGSGAGVGLMSVVFFLLDVWDIATPVSIFGIDIVLIGILAWRSWRMRGDGTRSTSDGAAPPFRWTWLLAVAFGIALLMSGSRLVQMAAALPVGDWDAWAIWNLRAKFIAGPDGNWRYALSPLLSNTHPDYPLLLSAFVARTWKASGGTSTIAPIVTAFAFFAALVALLVSAVTLLRSAASAILAGLVILSTTSLLIWVPAQYSDIPIALYYLAAIALIFLAASPMADERRALIWAGLCAGLAAWTKNEGIAFLVILTIVFFLITLWRRGPGAALHRSALLLTGAAPGIVLIVWLKFVLAPAVDPLVTQGASGLTRLLDVSRYAQVGEAFFKELLNLGSGVAHPLILLAILVLTLRLQMEEPYRSPSLIAAVSLGLVFLSYCATLVVAPYGLTWQLQTSFDRLFLQVWPSILLTLFVLLRSVVDTGPPTTASKSAVARKAPSRSAKRVPVKRG